MAHKYSALIFALLLSITLFSATPTISDSIDITHITIRMDITDYAGHTVAASAELHLKAKVDDITEIPLDLLALNVDSVIDLLGNSIAFTHIGELLTITLPDELNTGDSTTFTIYYHGEPEQDGSWGGWYWSGDYSYQLGVGFDAIPHNYGRVWFPCFDNFPERQTFRCEIVTTSDKKAFCGGLLESEIDNGDGTITWIWNLNQPIPSYLASVAVSTYATVNMTYEGVERDIPIQVAVKAEDSTDLKNSFINLNNAMSIFEDHYGPYAWDRVGYSIVPFSGGAMEHAMNIAYPLFAVTGGLTWESLYVHELSHHWWGDLITTSTAEEMWINEGWAVYSEHLFGEFMYGEETYRNTVKANHLDVLRNAAFQDGQNYFAISGVPQTYTYGYTTYRKGADVVHTMRGYMGDELFFECIEGFLETYQFQPVTGANLRDYLTGCSGIDMAPFFDGWVYQSGFPAFEIEDFGYANGGFVNSICIRQKLHHAAEFCNNVPLTITFFDSTWSNVLCEKTVMMSGEEMMVDLSDCLVAPYANAIIDYAEKINDAVTEDEVHIKIADDYDLDNALIDISVNAMSEPGYLYAQHYWVAADGFKTPVEGLHINSQRYWKLSGYLPASMDISAELLFNGQTVAGGFLDNEFITNSDDSLVLLYRSSELSDWSIYPYYTLNVWGNANDKRGAFELYKLLLGEYAIGMYDHSAPTASAETPFTCPDVAIQTENKFPLAIYPNPANDFISVETDNAHTDLKIHFINSGGDTVRVVPMVNNIMRISTKDLPAGTYQLYVENGNFEKVVTKKLVVIH